MPIAIRCGSCQAAFRVRDEFAGKKGKCPQCGAVFQAPAAATSAGAHSAPPAEGAAEQAFPDVAARSSSSSSSSLPKGAQSRPKTTRSRGAPPAAAQPKLPVQEIVPGDLSADSPAPAENDWPAIDAAPKPAARPVSKPATKTKASPAAAVVNFAASDDRLSRVSSRGHRKGVPVWAWFVTAGVLLLAILGVVAYRAWEANAQQVAQLKRDPEERRKAQGNAPRTEGFALKPVEKLDLKKPGPGAATEDIIAYVEHGIVKIDVYDEFNNRKGLGSGFVIDDSGLVATNYHVVDSAVKAEVLFNDGVRYGVEGYMALRPESDIAILKLNGTPPNMRSLDLCGAGQPRTAAQVYSIGHPHGNEFQVTNGIVSRVMKTSQLPSEAQQFLKSGLSDKVDNVWVSHTAQIAPGNSGGPLLNSAGEVIGVNSWVNQQINLGYAVYVGALLELKKQMFSSPQPLKDHRRPPPTLAQVGGQWGIQVTTEKLKQLASELAANNFACAGRKDYQKMQELAAAVTYVLHLNGEPDRADDKLKKLLPELARESQTIIDSLRSQAWQPGQIQSINKQAAEAIEGALEGVFVFGQVERLLEGAEGTRRGVLVKLLGHEQIIFLPLNDTQKEFKPAAGMKFLIAGVSFGASLHYGDNPLEPKEAPIVLSETFIELPSDTSTPADPQPSA